MDSAEVTSLPGLIARAAMLQRGDIGCTLAGGTDAMRDRTDQWQTVLRHCTGRLPADGGLTLVFDHDAAVTVELARLGAAEFECCSFFTFTLVVGPAGMRFTVTTPAEAADTLAALFGVPDAAAV